MANTKHEDAILKMGFDYFRDTILKILGIHHDFVESGITELVELTIHSLYMDFTFLTKDDFYIHIEFQTTDSGKKDLRRFHAYESVLSHKTGKNVITYVIYSGGIEHAVTEMKCGTYTYRVIPIFLTAKDADSVLKRLREKKQRGEIFTEEDFAQLAITPLMSSEIKRKDVILESIKLSKTEKSITAEKTMAMLYTLADKFLTGNDLEEVKEAVAMTRIGQMIFDDGVVRGREEERRLMSALISKLGYKPNDVVAGNLLGLSLQVKDYKKMAAELGIGEITLRDIVKELEKPARDPRDDMPKPILRSDVLEMKDLKEGMVLKGTVRNVIDFGAFVDIGVHQDGLVHISEMTERFIKHPLEAVSVGDIVDVRVIGVDMKKKRISLSMKGLNK